MNTTHQVSVRELNGFAMFATYNFLYTYMQS